MSKLIPLRGKRKAPIVITECIFTSHVRIHRAKEFAISVLAPRCTYHETFQEFVVNLVGFIRNVLCIQEW